MGDPTETALTTRNPRHAFPVVVSRAGDAATQRFLEFFSANIRNKNTRLAYASAAARFFAWCDRMGLALQDINPMACALYIEELMTELSAPSVKQHLAAIRAVFDYLVTGGILQQNPAKSVRGPKHSQRVGSTPVLSAEQARSLLDAIPLHNRRGEPLIVGYRDRALVGVMVYSFARVSAVVGMDRRDFYQQAGNWCVRLLEKGGKLHEVPAHHSATQYLAEYLELAGIERGAIFRSSDRKKQLTDRRMDRGDVLRMVKRHARKAGLAPDVCCHTFRATGITTFLENGGALETAQSIAAHSSPTTTKLYDRTGDELSLDEIERIRI